MGEREKQCHGSSRTCSMTEGLSWAGHLHAHHPPDLVLWCRIEAGMGHERWRQDTHLLLVSCAVSFAF